MRLILDTDFELANLIRKALLETDMVLLKNSNTPDNMGMSPALVLACYLNSHKTDMEKLVTEYLNQDVNVSFLQEADRVEITVPAVVKSVGAEFVRFKVLGDDGISAGAFSVGLGHRVRLLSRVETPAQELERLRDANFKMSEYIETLEKRVARLEVISTLEKDAQCFD